MARYRYRDLAMLIRSDRSGDEPKAGRSLVSDIKDQDVAKYCDWSMLTRATEEHCPFDYLPSILHRVILKAKVP